jgi:hypothetical protein
LYLKYLNFFHGGPSLLFAVFELFDVFYLFFFPALSFIAASIFISLGSKYYDPEVDLLGSFDFFGKFGA